MVDLNRVLDGALSFLFGHEVAPNGQSWSNNPADHGGATNYGITLGVFQGLGKEADLNHDGKVDAADLKMLKWAQARDIYHKLYWIWDKLDICCVQRVSPPLMMKQFDIAVNCGPKASLLMLQTAINRVCDIRVVVDGVLGSESLHAMLACDPGKLMAAYCKVQAERYEGIVAKDETQRVFLAGWENRAKQVPTWKG